MNTTLSKSTIELSQNRAHHELAVINGADADHDDRLPTVPALPEAEEVERALLETKDERGEKKLPATEDQIAEVLWLLAESRSRGLTTYGAIGKLINRDTGTISKLFRGKYGADLSNLVAHIRNFRTISTEQKALGDEPFVKGLTVVQKIVPFCDLARVARQVALIWGVNQSGKTEALRHYASTHPDTVYVKLPAGGGTNKSMVALAEACGISGKKSDVELWQRILKRFSRQSLLIVDEFHQAVHAGRKINTVTVDRLREIHDDCKCGVVLCGTDVVPRMMQDPRFKDFLGQLDNRGALRLYIPGGPTAADRTALYAAYHLPKPPEDAGKLAAEISKANGIARLTDYFKIARRLATNAGVTFGWEHFMTTHATLKTWATAEGK